MLAYRSTGWEDAANRFVYARKRKNFVFWVRIFRRLNHFFIRAGLIREPHTGNSVWAQNDNLLWID